MLKDNSADQGVSLSANDCHEVEELFSELLDTMGMILPALELASISENSQHHKMVGLARHMSARASLGLKKLLWKWGRLREWSTEEGRLRNSDELFTEFRAELQIAIQAGTVSQKSPRAISGLGGVLLSVFVVPFVSAQCVTHTRKFHNPWSWVKPTSDDGYKDLRRHWYKNPKEWLGFGIIAISIAADAYTTSDRPPGAVETNPLLGRHPTNRAIITSAGMEFAILATGHYLLWNIDASVSDDSALDRHIGYWAVPAISVTFSGRHAINNYRIASK